MLRYRSHTALLTALFALSAGALTPAPAVARDESSGAPAAADTEVRLMRMEEQFRTLNGQFEQLQHSIDQVRQALEKQQADNEYRLDTLEQRSAAISSPAAVAAEAPAAPPPAVSDSAVTPVSKPALNGTPTSSADPPSSSPATPAAATSSTPAASSTPIASESSVPPEENASAVPDDVEARVRNLSNAAIEPPTPREHYNQAFQLLNQARFDEARASLREFVQRYPKDPLIGNAFYWLGETYYVERDYLAAADTFRQGYEAAADGPKAPDNLLKLGMAMAAMGKEQDACVVYGQLATRYAAASATINQRVKQERTRLHCP